MEASVIVPLGEGEATVIGFFSPHEKPSEFCPGDDASFEIEKILVDGVDIFHIVSEMYTNENGKFVSVFETLTDKCLEKVEENIQEEEDFATIEAWERHREESFTENHW